MSKLYIDPERVQFEELLALPRDYPVEMLNLVRLRDRAKYEDERDLSGAEAYMIYSQNTAPFLKKVGGKIIWSGAPELMLIGPDDESWDIAFVVRYPNGQAFLDMVTDAGYQAIVFHRQAAVLTSRLIRTRPSEGKTAFD